MRRALVCFVASLVPLLTTGCVAPILYPMEAGPHPAMNGPTDKAHVIFVRPSRTRSGGAAFTLFDGKEMTGLGLAIDDTAFSVDLPPGEHLFCSVNEGSEGSTLTVANLAAGKTYLVRIDLVFANSVLVSVKPNSPDWKELMDQLKTVRGTVSSFVIPIGGMYANGFKDCLDNRKKLDKSDLAQFTINADDGVSL